MPKVKGPLQGGEGELAHILQNQAHIMRSCVIYRVTQNKVHHLLAILYSILEGNNTQVSYVVQCIIVNEVQFNEVLS